ncbi:MAG: endo alpha-1,4 polygalactosaminidase [Thermoleophilia bacterium]
MVKRLSAWTLAVTVVVVTAAAAFAAMGCATSASPPDASHAPPNAPSAPGGAGGAGPPGSGPSPPAEPGTSATRERLAEVDSWAFAIGDGALDGPPAALADRLGVFGLVVVDGEDATAEQVAVVRARGTIVLGYLSVGTIEPWRSWYGRLKPFVLDPWDEWGEYYADVADPAYRGEVHRIASAVLDKGFDGLFLDNVDMVDSHPDQSEGMRVLVSDLSRQVRGGGGVLFAQNGDDFALSMAALLDGWNREDVTFGYDFDTQSYVRIPAREHEAALASITSMRDAGVFVMTTDYVRTAGSADEVEALGAARGVGALPYVGDIHLTRVPPAPFSRPDA